MELRRRRSQEKNDIRSGRKRFSSSADVLSVSTPLSARRRAATVAVPINLLSDLPALENVKSSF
jgi:hypothetical protein